LFTIIVNPFCGIAFSVETATRESAPVGEPTGQKLRLAAYAAEEN